MAQDIQLTLLGTGTPPPSMTRFGPSILVEAGRQRFCSTPVVALQRLTQVEVTWSEIDGVFRGTCIPNHVVGFPDLWLTCGLHHKLAGAMSTWRSITAARTAR